MFVKFEIVKNKEYRLLSLLSAALAAILAGVLGVHPIASALIGLLVSAVLNLHIHFGDDTPVWAIALIGAVFSFFIYTEVQFAVGSSIASVSFVKMLLNWLVVYGLVILITVACGYIRYALIAVQALAVLLGIANHIVVQARGMEMQFSDLLSIGTAMDVAGDYSFALSSRTTAAVFFALIITLFLCLNRMPRLRTLKIRIGGLAVSTAALSLAVLLITTSWGSQLIGYQQRFWQIQATTENGFIVNFIRSISSSKVDRPSGYSKDSLEALLTEYIDQIEGPQITRPITPDPAPSDSPSETEPEVSKPNIIVVMNETFSDLAAIAASQGKQMQANTDLLPYFSSLSDDAPNIAKGFAMTSVFGGNTANSEFEFLTGHSMAFLPLNTVAYNSCVERDNAFSVVDILNKSGYRTVGMHPGPASNWNRANIYSYFGFDESYFLESSNGYERFVSDMPLREGDYYREYVSDSTVYDRIIGLYEQKEEGTPLFTFAVTMQNHGGYTYTEDQFDFSVRLNGASGSTTVNEYLTSVQNSDAALRDLIAYFEEAEEETLIVFFGDHQPSLTNEFYAEYFGIDDNSSTEMVQAKYAVPYLYWANFDFETEFGKITGLNYLSSHMLDIAGVEKTDYLKITDLVEKEVIAMNAFGWWDAEAVFHSRTEESSDSVSLLRLYEYLQYNALFDDAPDKLSDWFRLPEAALPPPTTEPTGKTTESDKTSDE